jgi:hypothetical protein
MGIEPITVALQVRLASPWNMRPQIRGGFFPEPFPELAHHPQSFLSRYFEILPRLVLT